MTLRALIIAAACVAVASLARAGDVAPTLSGYALTTWTQTDGPFAGDAWAIAQDRQGYLWFGTPSGLVRFDGVRFVPWQGSQSIPHTRVSALCAARDGSLWLGFGLKDGVSRIQGDQLTSYTQPDGVMVGPVVSLVEDRQGTIWAGGNAGLVRFRAGHWEQLGPAEGLAAGPVQSLFEDRKGDLWVGSAHGVYRKAGEGRFELVDATLHSVRAFAEDTHGAMWITDPTVALRPLARQTTARPKRSAAGGMSLLRDRRGSLWVATVGQGLLRLRDDLPLRPAGDVATKARRPAAAAAMEQITTTEGLTSAFVRSVFEDRDGNIWFGMQGGLGRLSQSSFSTVVGGVRLDGGYVRSVTTTTDGAVWLASVDGLKRYLNGTWKGFGPADGFDVESLYAMHAVDDGTLWIGTDRGPMHYAGGRFLALPVSDERLDRTVAITADHEGGVWFCDVRRGVFRWKDRVLTRFSPRTQKTIGFTVATDRQGRVWIGLADGGLLVYDRGNVRSFSAPDGLAGGTVNTIYEDRKGTIWIGTTEGLSRFRHEQLATVTGIAPLENGVLSLVDDEQGYLWLGVFSGVLRVEPGEFDRAASQPAHAVSYARFDAADGLASSPRRQSFPSAARDAHGLLWFLTERGAVLADPREIRLDQRAPATDIEGITVDDRTYTPVDGRVFGPGLPRIQIDYTAPALGGSNKVQFRYKLEGFDPDWVDAGTRRQAFYTNLPPRRYRFRVMTGNNGTWNESATSWGFTVRPAFYQTGWFLILCIGAVILLVFSAWRLRLGRVHERYALVLAERTRVGRELHDTLLQGLFGLCLQLDAIIAQLESSPDGTRSRLHRTRGLMEQYIRETRHSIWKLRSPSLDGSDFVAALRRAADAFVTATGVLLELNVRGQPRKCDPDVEEQLLRIGQEAISNAVRHAEATEIRVDVEYEKHLFRLRVSDNGRGISQPDAQQLLAGSGWGLTSMRERAGQIGGNLTVRSRSNRGTELELVVATQ